MSDQAALLLIKLLILWVKESSESLSWWLDWCFQHCLSQCCCIQTRTVEKLIRPKVAVSKSYSSWRLVTRGYHRAVLRTVLFTVFVSDLEEATVAFTSHFQITPNLNVEAGISWNSPGQGSHPEGPKPDGSNGPTGTRGSSVRTNVKCWIWVGSNPAWILTAWIAALWVRGLGGHQAGHEPAIDPSCKGQQQYARMH